MKFARENNFLESLARWLRHCWALLRINHEITKIAKKYWQTNFKQIRRTHPRGSKMGKSSHVRTSVKPHSNLKLVSLFPRGSKMGKSDHVRTSVEPHSNLKLVSLFCKARTILATPERVRKQVRNLHLSLGGFKTLHVRVIHEKFKTLLLHWFQKIRQKLVSKETYVELGKTAVIVYKTWVARYPSRP